MAFNDLIINNYVQADVILNGVAMDDSASGPTLQMLRAEAGTVSATVALTADTATLTLTPRWEVSADAATWTLASVANSAAYVLQADQAGDASNTRVMAAPNSVYSQRFARVSILLGNAGGGAADLANVGYNFIDSNSV